MIGRLLLPKWLKLFRKLNLKKFFNYVSAFWTMYFECMKETFNFLDNVYKKKKKNTFWIM